MSTTSFKIEAEFPVTVERLYNAWLNGEDHGLMTGAPATGSPEEGADFSAWDGYIEGRNLHLEPNKRIVQSWRTSDFDEEDAHSLLELLFMPTDSGCKLILIHTEIPEDQPDYEEGWQEHYITPMKLYFT